MKLGYSLLAAGAATVLAFAPAYAGGSHTWGSSTSGGWSSSGGSTSGGWSSSGGSTSGGSTSGGSTSGGSTSGGSTSGGATSVPEPSDAVLLLMGAAGVVVGRKLHARKRRS